MAGLKDRIAIVSAYKDWRSGQLRMSTGQRSRFESWLKRCVFNHLFFTLLAAFLGQPSRGTAICEAWTFCRIMRQIGGYFQQWLTPCAMKTILTTGQHHHASSSQYLRQGLTKSFKFQGPYYPLMLLILDLGSNIQSLWPRERIIVAAIGGPNFSWTIREPF